MSEQIQAALARPNLIAFVVLFLCGFFVMTTNSNMIKKLIGLNIHTSVFSISISVRRAHTSV